jgi:hypothetical protein
VDGWRIAPLIAECPRGSFISNRLTSSRCSRKYRRRSFMVAPGMVPMPPVITRVGMPSVCESTACRTSLLRMTGLLPYASPAATAFSVAARTAAS